jgi:hypothetical protein
VENVIQFVNTYGHREVKDRSSDITEIGQPGNERFKKIFFTYHLYPLPFKLLTGILGILLEDEYEATSPTQTFDSKKTK